MLANQEVQRLNHDYIGTEHLLLGLAKESTGAGARILKDLGVDLPTLRAEIDKLVVSGPDKPTTGRPSQTTGAKMVIEYAIQEARALNHDHIGSEHILLGLLRENEGVAAQVLTTLGVRLEDVRQAVLKIAGGGPCCTSSPPPHERLTDPVQTALERANQEAQRFNYEYVGTEHVLLGLIREGRGLAATALANRGVDLEKLRRELDALVKSGPETVTPLHLPETPRLREAMTHAADEARRQNHAFVNSGHVLLGLLHESSGLAAQTLFNLGVTPGDLRRELSWLAAEGLDDRSEARVSDIWEAAGASGTTGQSAAPEPAAGQPAAASSEASPAPPDQARATGAENLAIWKRADELTRKVYDVAGGFAKGQVWGVAEQLRKNALTIPPGIAEAYRRRNKVEARWFVNAVLTALSELQYGLDMSLSLGHLKNEDHAALKPLADELYQQLHTVHKSLGG